MIAEQLIRAVVGGFSASENGLGCIVGDSEVTNQYIFPQSGDSPFGAVQDYFAMGEEIENNPQNCEDVTCDSNGFRGVLPSEYSDAIGCE